MSGKQWVRDQVSVSLCSPWEVGLVNRPMSPPPPSPPVGLRFGTSSHLF